jgi:hypothetical protein
MPKKLPAQFKQGNISSGTQFLGKLLFNHFPWVGKRLQLLAVQRLEVLCLHGDAGAARLLAESLDLSLDPAVIDITEASLIQVRSGAALDAVWETWANNRSPRLGAILERINKEAETSSPAYEISLLKLNRLLAIRNEGSTATAALIAFCHDLQPEIASRAVEVIQSLKNKAAVDQLCLLWSESRSSFLLDVIRKANYQPRKPIEVKLLLWLKLKQVENVLQSDAAIVPPLLAACHDPDEEIKQLASTCLLNLQNQKAITELCRIWAERRDPELEEAILKAAYLPDQPYSLRLLIALKTGRRDLAYQATPGGLNTLIAAQNDPDPAIAANANKALLSLSDPATREALCEHVLVQKDPLCERIAIEAGYRPRSVEKCALFLYLTGQFPDYEALDFDNRIMQAVYSVASPDLKTRITRQVQLTGKSSYLRILAGIDFRTGAGQIGSQEIELLVRILAQNQEWERLWNLVFELPLIWSIEIVRILVPTEWQPAPIDERILFKDLGQRISRDLPTDVKDLRLLMPAAFQRATLKVHGRINDLRFAGDRSILAIGTGTRKLGLWDFRKGSIQRTLNGFNHSISQIAYCGEYLVCGQRSNKDALCAIYAWHNDQSFLLGSHQGAVTTLESLDETRLLSTGRDQKAIVWDLVGRKPLRQVKFPFWPHAAAVSPDRKMAAFVHQGLTLANLSTLAIIRAPVFNRRKTEVHKGAATSVAFTPDGDAVLVGQHNGQIILYSGVQNKKTLGTELVISHLSQVNGLQFIPGHPIFVSCSQEGALRFTSWPDGKSFGTQVETGQILTSLHVSPDGSFLATGTRDATIILWDLRVLDLPDLFSTPIAQIKPGQTGALSAILEEEDLPASIRNSLEFFSNILQHRYQFNVEIGDAPSIARGEFDVLID